jgi:agmatinase
MRQFLDYDNQYEKAKYVILPVPMEMSVSYGKGTAKAPQAILDASIQIESYEPEYKGEPIEVGIHTSQEISQNIKSPEEMLEEIEDRVSEIVSHGKVPIALGGEHSLSYGVFKGLSEHYKDFSIIHFDAHLDLRDTYEGSKYSHACVLRRMMDHKEDFKNITSIGVRSVSPEEADYLEDYKNKIIYGEDLEKGINYDFLRNLK